MLWALFDKLTKPNLAICLSKRKQNEQSTFDNALPFSYRGLRSRTGIRRVEKIVGPETFWLRHILYFQIWDP